LITLGVTMIAAIPELILFLGPNLSTSSNLSTASGLAIIGMVLASVGAGLLAYGIAAKPTEGNPMQPQ